MVRNYTKKTSRGSWSKADMQKALDLCINEKKSCVSTAKQMNIPEPTLRRYIKKKMQLEKFNITHMFLVYNVPYYLPL